MIVCKQCGHHNAAGDTFCGSCGSFLEWTGEQITPEPAPEPAAEPVVETPGKVGIVTRIKHAIAGDDDVPVTGATATTSGATTLPTPPATPRSDGGALPPPTVLTPEDEARRRAAAMVAKPAPPPPTQGPGAMTPTPTRPSTPAPVTPEPDAQLPGAATARPRPTAKQSPSRVVNPGDLICKQCGEANDPDRKFCRRCGESLAEVAPVKKRGFFKRLFTREPKPVADAGARPMRDGGGRGSDVAKGARQAKGFALGQWASARRILALLAVLGIGGAIVLPQARGWVTDKIADGYNAVRRTVAPEYTPVPVQNAEANAFVPGHEPTLLVDGGFNTEWSAPAGTPNPTIVITFDPAQTVDVIGFTTGNPNDRNSFNAQPRPEDLVISVTKTDGGVINTSETLDYKPEFQTVDVDAGEVIAVQIAISSCYPSPVGGQDCSMAEIEFQKKK